MTDANERKEVLSSGSFDNEGYDRLCTHSTRQYCTQACLLGLKLGWDFDKHCTSYESV